MSKLFIVMYHYTRDLRHSRYPNIKALDLELFKQQLDFFEQNFAVIRMEDVLEAINGGKALPENALLLTFDDGYIDNYTVAFPLLMERGMQGSFFIPCKTFTENVLLDVNKIHFVIASAPIDRLLVDLKGLINEAVLEFPSIPSYDELYAIYAEDERFDDKDTIFVKRILQTALPEKLRSRLSSILFEKYVGRSEADFSRELYVNHEQLRLMRKCGMFIGIHGYDHCWLSNLTEEQMREDIDKALGIMDEFIDRNAWVMNYPYGVYNEAVISHIKDKGCKLGLTTEARVVDLSLDDVYRFPRLDCNDFPPKSDNYKIL
ncbi:MAG: polysaccharide deacetylase family protein [Clostridium sp.]|nr:polysaccharide deacetylase family protein [Clostridium sp.]